MPRGDRVGILILAGAIGLAIGLTDPLHAVIGSATVDGFGTQWFFWFAGEVLAGRQRAGFTDQLFFPWGKDLYAHTGGNLLDAFLAAPLRAALGPVLGFNVWIVALLASNAWAGTRLAAAFGAPAGRRWPAGLLLVLNPYVLGELDFGRPTQAWLAPSALCLAMLVGMESAGAAAMVGLLMALAAFGYWYYGLLLGALAAIHGLWRMAAGPGRLRAAGLHALAAAVALVAVAPFAAPLLEAVAHGDVPGLLALDGDGPLAPLALRTVEGDAQGLYVLAPLAAVESVVTVGSAAGSLLDEASVGDPARLRFDAGVGAVSWAHFVVFALGLWALRGQLRRWGWVGVGMFFALLVASGPVFVIGDHLVANRPYVALTAHLDLLRRWWWPGRAVLLVHLLVAPLGAVLLAAPSGRGARGRALGGVLLLGILAPLRHDALLPIGQWDAAVPPTLRCLAAAPTGAVIDLPLLVDQRNLWYQTVHGHPILGGMLLKKAAFAPPELATLRADNPFLHALLAVGDQQFTQGATADAEGLAVARQGLVSLGYRYVLARADAFRHPRPGRTEWASDWGRAERLLVALLGSPATEDPALAAWTLDGTALDCPARP